MNKNIRCIAMIVTGSCAIPAIAAVSAEEARQLGGATLTQFGAEKAGNKEGTIPEYTGEPIKVPACYNPKEPGTFCDPWNDKPLFTITAQNMAQYADKLTPGQKEMFKKFPDYKMSVFPTRRTHIYPKYVIDNTLKNATSCKGTKGELSLEGCLAGLPFPIPKTGNQVMWNHLLKYGAYAYGGKIRSILVDTSGKLVNQGDHEVTAITPYYSPSLTKPLSGNLDYWRIRIDTFGPARKSGEKLLATYSVDPIGYGDRAYQYIPGQRRVKLAPDLAYDTPTPYSGGGTAVDEQNVFLGSQDRYDFKLVGKQEAFIIYNAFNTSDYKRCSEGTYIQKSFPNPDCIRWELHRTWHVHATLKPGFRHILPTRDFYFDEDNPGAGRGESFDAGGKLYRIVEQLTFPYYDVGSGGLPDSYLSMDLQRGVWSQNSFGLYPGYGYTNKEAKPDTFYTPDAMASGGIR